MDYVESAAARQHREMQQQLEENGTNKLTRAWRKFRTIQGEVELTEYQIQDLEYFLFFNIKETGMEYLDGFLACPVDRIGGYVNNLLRLCAKQFTKEGYY